MMMRALSCVVEGIVTKTGIPNFTVSAGENWTKLRLARLANEGRAGSQKENIHLSYHNLS